MPKPTRPRPLHDHEIEMIRLVAAGYTNAQLAVAADISVETIRSRMHVVHQLIGTASDGGGDSMARVRMVIWAYDHHLVKPRGVKAVPGVPLPQERIAAELAAPMIRLSLDILADQPRGDLRRWAQRVVDAAGLTSPESIRRGPPVVVADGNPQWWAA